MVHLKIDDIAFCSGRRPRRYVHAINDLADVRTPVFDGGIHPSRRRGAALHDGDRDSHTPQGFAFGAAVCVRPMQFIPLAMIRAVVVLPLLAMPS